MSVARERLTLKELFYDLDTYEIVRESGRELFLDFDILQLEGALFGAGEYMRAMEFSEQDIMAAAKE